MTPKGKVGSGHTFDVAAFVNGYVTAFEARDAAGVAAFYHVPCLSVRGGGEVNVFTSASDLERFFAQVLDFYVNDGMATFVALDPNISELGKAAVRFTCRWEMKRHDGSLIREWSQSYLFQRNADRWRIITSVFHQ